MSETVREPIYFKPTTNAMMIIGAMVLIGLATFTLGYNEVPRRIWYSFLVSFFFFVSVAVGGLFFTALQHATKAGWSVTIRRISESLTGFLPIGLVGAVVLLFGAPSLYEWLDAEVVAHDLLLQKKSLLFESGIFCFPSVFIFWFVGVLCQKTCGSFNKAGCGW